jgi:hypothetical protein
MKATSKQSLITKKRKGKTFGSDNSIQKVRVLKRKSVDEIDKNDFGGFSQSQSSKNSKLYKIRSLAVDLVKYFKNREDESEYEEGVVISITQNELIESMIKLGYSRSYVYMRLKVYSSSVSKFVENSDKFNVLDPLLVKRNRSFHDGNAGWVYSLNESWRDVSINDIERAFQGV